MKSKYCLSSTTSFDKINKAATNRSITKQTFSFARSSRFEAPKSKYRTLYIAVRETHTVATLLVVNLQELRLVMVKSQISRVALQFLLHRVSTT